MQNVRSKTTHDAAAEIQVIAASHVTNTSCFEDQRLMTYGLCSIKSG